MLIVSKIKRVYEIDFDKNILMKKSNLTKACKQDLAKYKKKYIDEAVHKCKFLSLNEIGPVCEEIIKKHFVDISQNQNFLK